MRGKRYRDPNELYYSSIYGGGIYEWNGELVQDPLGGGREEGLCSPLLTNLITGEVFFLKRLPAGERARAVEQILAPARNEHILWPSDVVHLNEGQQAACSLFVAREYAPTPTARQGADALLFPYGGYPSMTGAQRRLSQIETPSWKSQAVRGMAVEIARALESVNRSGYFYADMHLSRIYFADSGRAYFDFSNLVFSLQSSVGPEAEALCGVRQGEYPIEFADPALVQGRAAHADLHAQDYSLCALFFYLFLGRYPYDGRLLTGYVDDTPQRHYIKFRDYHKMPVFIFDPEDASNSLGAFWEERQVIELWRELPGRLRELFVQTLRRENAERSAPVNNPTPSAWLLRFEELGWLAEGLGQEAKQGQEEAAHDETARKI